MDMPTSIHPPSLAGFSCGYEECGVTGTAKQYSFYGPGAISTDAGLEKIPSSPNRWD